MKRCVFSSLLVALATFGCGSWSNADLEFANALPNREALRSKLPVTASSKSPLSGVSTRRDGLDVGEPSGAYADAKKAATEFNGILDFLLTVLDRVRQVPPTSRSPDARIWGPYPDSANPGYEGQVRVQQDTADTFSWWLEERPTGGAFFDIVTGDFQATTSVKKGTGTMVVHVADFRDRLKVDDNNIKKLDAINIDYDTRGFPIEVTMSFVDASGPRLSYVYEENEDRSGSMDFILTTTDPNITSEKLTAQWTTEGSGRTDAVVLDGGYAGFAVTECWDSAFKVSFYSANWSGGQTSGVATSCSLPRP